MKRKISLNTFNSLIKYGILSVLLSCLMASCNYLDVIPDNIATIDHAFNSRSAAEDYLYGCYSFRLPIGQISGDYADPALGGGDETWQDYSVNTDERFAPWPSSRIARGEQNVVTPLLDHWHHLYTGIRYCNIFLDNINNVYDIQTYERNRWTGEVKFLKAYYHYLLFKRYGPIPITDVTVPVAATLEEAQVYREPVDAVVEYIAATLDDALQTLPEPQEVIEGTEAGRVDKLVALTMKAELLLFAASDLFNGNTEMANMVDNRGVALFPQEKKPEKWRLAADACKAAIDACHAHGKALYDRPDPRTVNENSIFKLQSVLRQTIGDSWNTELIWGDTKYDAFKLSRAAGTRLTTLNPNPLAEVTGQWAPTLKMVELYYSSRGVPIENDKEWLDNGWYENRFKIRPEPSSGDEKYFVETGMQTVNLHFNREPRFYASVAFDKGVYYGTGWYQFDNSRNVKYADYTGLAGYIGGEANSITGYGVKKMYHLHASQSLSSTSPGDYFPFPIYRLADLYLMYAEALNEAEGPVDLVFEYVNKVRERAGLETVQHCWDSYTNLPKGYYNDKANMREIIRRERTVELAFEGKRFYDLRRWRKISEFNVTPMGWNTYGDTPEDFYNRTILPLITLNFTVKDYFWPLKESDLYVNPNLKQNYGW